MYSSTVAVYISASSPLLLEPNQEQIREETPNARLVARQKEMLHWEWLGKNVVKDKWNKNKNWRKDGIAKKMLGV